MKNPKPPTSEELFAEIARAARTSMGTPQSVLAMQMSDRGFTAWRQSTVAKVEAGERPISLNEFVVLCDLLRIPTSRVVARLIKAVSYMNEAEVIEGLRAEIEEARDQALESYTRFQAGQARVDELSARLDSLLQASSPSRESDS